MSEPCPRPECKGSVHPISERLGQCNTCARMFSLKGAPQETDGPKAETIAKKEETKARNNGTQGEDAMMGWTDERRKRFAETIKRKGERLIAGPGGETLKRCMKCAEEKPLSSFFMVGGGKYYDSKCKRCRMDKQQEARARKRKKHDAPVRPLKKAAATRSKASIPPICEPGQVIQKHPDRPKPRPAVEMFLSNLVPELRDAILAESRKQAVREICQHLQATFA